MLIGLSDPAGNSTTDKVRETYNQAMLLADAPSITDWMQGWGSLLGSLIALVATIASIVAVVYTRRLLQHEITVRRDERINAESAQARLVLSGAGWDKEGTRLEVTVWNYSAAPILDLEIDVLLRATGAEIGSYYDPPGRPIMPGGEVAEIFDGFGMPEIPLDRFPHEIFSIRTRFLDAAGKRWQRTDRDEPVRHGFPPEEHEASATRRV